MLLFALALGIRTFRAFQETIANPDTMRYVDQMHGLVADPLSNMRTEVYHPLHAALGLAVHTALAPFFFDERMGWLWSLRIVGILFGSLVTLQIVRLSRWFGAPFWAAIGAGLIWIFGRRTSVYGADGLSDMVALSLFAESILQAMPALQALQRGGKPRVLRLLLSGLLSGLAYLARPEGVGAALIVAMTLAALATCRTKSHRSRRFKMFPHNRLPLKSAIAAAALLGMGYLVAALPYILIIGGFTGKKTIFAPAAASAASAATAGSPPNPVYKVMIELQETFSWAPWIVLLLAMLLLPRLWGRPRLRVMAIIWIALWNVIMFWLLARAGYLDGRHTLALVLFIHVLFALALVAWTRPLAWWMARYRKNPAAWSALPTWRRWRGWPHAAAGIVLVLALTPGIVLLGDAPRRERTNLIAAANWIRDHAPADVVVCDNERLVGYYSGRACAKWSGFQKDVDPSSAKLNELEKIRQTHAGASLILGFTYLPGSEIKLAVGPYAEVARFVSGKGASQSTYVLYADPAEFWKSKDP